MFQRLVDLLKPDVSTEAKLTAVTVTVGKVLERLIARVDTHEIKTLIPLRDGVDGRDGKDAVGKNGKNGVSVVDAEIAADDHLVLKLSDGKIIDAGELPKADGTQSSSVHVSGNAYQITVSTVAPVSPQVNDLWLDIS